MTCKDCVHYEACKDMYDGYAFDFDDCDFTLDCINMGLFKNKADFVEVKRGRWETRNFIIFDSEKTGCRCTECNTTWDTETNYCPYCGADMRKEGADNG